MWVLSIVGISASAILIAWKRSGQSWIDYFCFPLMRAYARLYHNMWVRKRAELPSTGPAILVSNHTCSADPEFLQALTRRSMSFLVAEEYFTIPGVGWIFKHMQSIPVNRDGSDARSVRVALRRLKDGRIVCMFPEGSLSGTGRGRMRKAKRGAAYLALRSGVPIYPAFISGGPQHTHVASAWLLPSRGGIVLGRPIDLSAFLGQRITRPLLEQAGTLIVRSIMALDPLAGKPRRPRPPLGENPYDRKRLRSRKKALSSL